MNEKNNLLKVIIIILVLILIATVVVGFIYINKKGEKIEKIEKEKKIEEIILPLEEFIVNLKEEDGLSSYLKIKIALMYGNKKEKDFLETSIEKIRDVINGELRSKSSSEILNEEEVIKIKSNMKDCLNKALDKEVIKDIYFTDIVVQ